VNIAFDVTGDYMDIFCQITNEFYTRNCRVMKLVQCLAVLVFDVSKYVVLCLDERIVRVLSCNELALFKQSFDLVNRDVPIHVTSDHVYVLILSDSLKVNASHSVSLNFFVS